MTYSPALAGALSDAARIVARVASGESLRGELDRAAGESSKSTRPILLDLVHGTLRRYGWVQAIVRELSRREPEALVAALVWCALYSIESGRRSEYTVVNQAVEACNLLGRSRAKSFVNAVLRNFLRRRDEIKDLLVGDLEALYQHPAWWVGTLRLTYETDWREILAAGNSHPPMTLRINRRRTDVVTYQALLEREGVRARSLGAQALTLERPVPIDRLPGFMEGMVSVQDAGAQRAACNFDLSPGQRVLDACAAPGGKTAHILETADVELTALDMDRVRSGRIRGTLHRLGLDARIMSADCTRLGTWWDGKPFDRILADVPCTASGVVRRHPDVKWLRRESDVAAFAARQLDILKALWQPLAPDGKLLYATCSVFREENEAVVEALLQHVENGRRLALPDGFASQTLPRAETDGFFYALIQKEA